MPDIRIAIGPTASGMDGFRRSHFDAITTQQMMARLHSPQQIAMFTDVQLVALITADTDRAAEFVNHTLGDLESAGTELQDTVRTFVEEQCNASRAAERLYTHRNTLLRRLARADELLPRPLAESSVDVAVALDVVRWRGNRGLNLSRTPPPHSAARRPCSTPSARAAATYVCAAVAIAVSAGSIARDESAKTPPRFEQPRRLQLPVCARHRIDRQAQLPRQFTDRRQTGTWRQLAVPDPIDDLRPELVEKRLGGLLINAYPIPQLATTQYPPNRLVW